MIVGPVSSKANGYFKMAPNYMTWLLLLKKKYIQATNMNLENSEWLFSSTIIKYWLRGGTTNRVMVWSLLAIQGKVERRKERDLQYASKK